MTHAKHLALAAIVAAFGFALSGCLDIPFIPGV